MTSAPRRTSLIAVLVASFIALLALATSANAYPAGTAGVAALNTSRTAQGCTITVTGQNFNGTVTLTDDTGTVTQTAQADSSGSFSASVALSSSYPTGSHSITASDAVGDSSVLNFTVDAAGASCTGQNTGGNNGGNNGGGLSNTGVAVLSIGGLGTLLLIGGAFLLLAGRRSKATV